MCSVELSESPRIESVYETGDGDRVYML